MYHHLRILKGLIEQNTFKKYVLTEEGKKALDVIFQEQMPQRNVSIHPVLETDGVESVPSILESDKADQQIGSLTPPPSATNIQTTIKHNSIQDFFNVKAFLDETIPKWFYNANFIGFLLLFLLFEAIQPKFVFFHFVPVKIENIFYSLLILVFPGLNVFILFIISRLKKEMIKISTLGVLVFYYNIVIILTIVSNILQLYDNSLEIRILSILIQGLFIFLWTISVSLQYYSWEKSLFLAILQNYLLFILF